MSTSAAAPRPERWPWALALGALVVYVATALWLLYAIDYHIGDALYRTANARFMLQSRDPHLAAVGFVWPPLPVLLQLPFMLVLGPLQHAVVAGPLSTACCGALTVPVIAAICRSLDLSRPLAITLTAAYALNPVTVFSAANGMSEAWFYLFTAVALLGLVRWTRRRKVLDLVVMAAGLASAMLVRYETLALVPVLALAAALQEPRRRWASVLLTVGLPALYAFGLWLFASLLIMRDPFFWLKAQTTVGHTPVGAPWLPDRITLASSLGYAARLTVGIGPGLVAMAPLLVLRRHWSSALAGLGLLCGGLLFPALIVAQLLRRVTWADPRYFEALVLFTTIAAAWLAAEWRPPSARLRWAFQGALVGLLVLGGVTATVTLSNPVTTQIEQEQHFFGWLLGRRVTPLREVSPMAIQGGGWQRLVHDLDPRLTPESPVITDVSEAFPAVVFTRHPRLYVVSSDRDFEEILADPIGRVGYLIRPTSGPLSGALDAVLASHNGGEWKLLGDYQVARVYQWIPSKSTPTNRRP
jgi:4-amino-4-deoxy-L-arabinose transferase-like glycosyltransferase